ncbi:hypothetical protein BJ085DRAFT_27774 [Dimargaris cristalligena]|uniref:Uncharacterized protein n=1 Tax=Dimargaris cristalligena TaxID=215637 RepID=A0A4P9ZWH1_9FUNG|nr:hypothetical protein BJ085DRAFT_27774 [Dimargaris cristalligena]|eukprot:RKP37668.1 hypothetical protein BJ085DRAFT_27774 [Dimargaris cristalligena]
MPRMPVADRPPYKLVEKGKYPEPDEDSGLFGDTNLNGPVLKPLEVPEIIPPPQSLVQSGGKVDRGQGDLDGNEDSAEEEEEYDDGDNYDDDYDDDDDNDDNTNLVFRKVDSIVRKPDSVTINGVIYEDMLPEKVIESLMLLEYESAISGALYWSVLLGATEQAFNSRRDRYEQAWIAIREEWAYVDYDKLSPSQQSTAFPFLTDIFNEHVSLEISRWWNDDYPNTGPSAKTPNLQVTKPLIDRIIERHRAGMLTPKKGQFVNFDLTQAQIFFAVMILEFDIKELFEDAFAILKMAVAHLAAFTKLLDYTHAAHHIKDHGLDYKLNGTTPSVCYLGMGFYRSFVIKKSTEDGAPHVSIRVPKAAFLELVNYGESALLSSSETEVLVGEAVTGYNTH